MKGVTLLELVLVVALVGILGATVVPRVVTSTAGLDSAAKKIRSDVLYAQSLAMGRGVNHGLDFVAGGSYVLYRGTPSTPVTDPLTLKNFSENLARFGHARVTNSYRVEFDTLGRPVLGAGGGVTIAIGSQTKSVNVNANTGHVVIP